MFSENIAEFSDCVKEKISTDHMLVPGFEYRSDEEEEPLTLAQIQEKESLKLDKSSSDVGLTKKQKKSQAPTVDDNTVQCELCFNYYEKSYIWKHKTNVHKVLKGVPKRTNFKCKDCPQKFELKSDLYQHRKDTHANAEEFCKLCNVMVSCKDLSEHKLNIHGIKVTNYTCKQCDTTFTSRGQLQRHKFEVHCLPEAGRPLMPCDICFKTFLKTSLTRHRFEAHNIRDEETLRKGKATTCEYCGKSFDRKYEFLKHNCEAKKKSESQKKPDIICEICNEVIFNETKRQHRLKHGRPVKKVEPQMRKNYRCVDCGDVFVNKKFYISHRKISHLGMLKEFHCKLCLDSFDTKEAWDEHMKEYGDHGGQFTCSLCVRTFQSEGGLRMHQNKHQKKFSCDICHMNLSSNSSLLTHKTKHSGLKPYECHICNKSFPYLSSLKYHMRTHEDKKYVCQFCGQKFTFSFNFTRHIEQHHGKPEEKVICEHCGGLFAKHRIKDHLARHGSPSLPCDLCGKKFKVMNQVRKHKNQVHKKELVRYECPICSKAFIRKEIMEAHLSKHRPDLQEQSVENMAKERQLVQSAITIDLTSTMSLYFTN